MLPFNIGVGGASGVDVGDIGHSLRLRSAAVAYLSRTPASAGNRRTWTWSGWIKLGALGAIQVIFNQGGVSTNYTLARLNTSNQLDFHSYGGGSYNFQKVTSAVFRDPTAFIHVMFVLDATNTQARIYVNGVEATYTTNTNPTNTDQPFNQAALHYLGAATTPTQYFDGYLSRIAFVDGTALTPSSFGYQNTEINEWVSKYQSQVKAIVDAGGTNSFMLDFDDGTSLTTLGYDKSSKGNNWTLNNFSLTAGTTYDHMLDVPGNSYATWSNLNSVTYATKSNGNITLTGGGAVGTGAQVDMASIAIPSGLAYWEVLITGTVTTNDPNAGIANVGTMTPSESSGNMLGGGVAGYGMVFGGVHNGKSFHNSALSSAYTTFAQNDVVQYALDMVSGKLFVGKNGTWLNSGSPTGGTGEIFSGLSGSFAPAASCTVAGSILTLCCGQAPLHASATYHTAAGGYFRYTPPTGFKALCQANLPDPAILNPEKHFDAVTRVGFGASGGSVTSLQFKPDSYWGKVRNGVTAHNLVDSVRGVSNVLFSNLTNAEASAPTFLTSFNSNGYTMGAGDYTGAESVVEWLWKAGGAAVTNNAGSVSSQVSANVDAGFSIVTYTGTGANATVGHGLGVAPAFTIIKDRDTATNWFAWHKMLNGGAPTNYALFLNLTNAQGVDGTYYNSAMPNSTTLPIGTNAAVNSNTKHYVAYCFAEIPGYSKIGSYTGNGSADGPFVPLGFKPKFVMVKRSDSTGSWQMFDSLRAGYNVDNDQLVANTSATEVTTDLLDLTSSSFKVRSTSIEVNASGGTYIFIAFADVPGKYSLAR